MNFVVVDASVWVARLIPQDAFHAAVKAWMEQQRQAETTLLSPALLLSEIAGAISRRSGAPDLAQQAVEQIQRLPEVRLIAIDADLVQHATRLAAALGLRGADAFYVAAAEHLGLRLATLDADQARRAAGQITIETI